MGTTVIGTRISEELAAKLDAEAAKLGMTRSECLAVIAESHLSAPAKDRAKLLIQIELSGLLQDADQSHRRAMQDIEALTKWLSTSPAHWVRGALESTSNIDRVSALLSRYEHLQNRWESLKAAMRKIEVKE